MAENIPHNAIASKLNISHKIPKPFLLDIYTACADSCAKVEKYDLSIALYEHCFIYIRSCSSNFIDLAALKLRCAAVYLDMLKSLDSSIDKVTISGFEVKQEPVQHEVLTQKLLKRSEVKKVAVAHVYDAKLLLDSLLFHVPDEFKLTVLRLNCGCAYAELATLIASLEETSMDLDIYSAKKEAIKNLEYAKKQLF